MGFWLTEVSRHTLFLALFELRVAVQLSAPLTLPFLVLSSVLISRSPTSTNSVIIPFTERVILLYVSNLKFVESLCKLLFTITYNGFQNLVLKTLWAIFFSSILDSLSTILNPEIQEIIIPFLRVASLTDIGHFLSFVVNDESTIYYARNSHSLWLGETYK